MDVVFHNKAFRALQTLLIVERVVVESPDEAFQLNYGLK